MTAPILEIVEKLKERKFINKKTWSPLSIGAWTVLPIKDLILRFRTILAGFTNFYSFVNNREDLIKIYWILKESLRKTICRKKGIGYSEFLKTFGPKITLKIRKKNGDTVELDFARPNLRCEPKDFRGSKMEDPLSVRD